MTPLYAALAVLVVWLAVRLVGDARAWWADVTREDVDCE